MISLPPSVLQEFKGYVFKIMGGQDKQGFPMKQGVLTNGRVQVRTVGCWWLWVAWHCGGRVGLVCCRKRRAQQLASMCGDATAACGWAAWQRGSHVAAPPAAQRVQQHAWLADAW